MLVELQNGSFIQSNRYSLAHEIQVSSEGLASLFFHGDDGHCHKVSGPLGHWTLSTHMCPDIVLSEDAGMMLPLSAQPSCLHTTPTVAADMLLLPTLPQTPL